MLTDNQHGMLTHHVPLSIRTLIDYFVVAGGDQDGYRKVMQIIQEAYENRAAPGVEFFSGNKTKDQQWFKLIPEVIDNLKKTLNPDYFTLNKLGVLNGSRDTVKVKIEEFTTELINEIKEDAIRIVERIVRRNEYLLQHKDLISFIDFSAPEISIVRSSLRL